MTNRISDFSFSVNPEAAASIHDSGIVILHIGDGRLYASNGTGARIWRGVEEQLSLEAITDELSDEYQIDRATAREDVVRFLAELRRHTLIQRETES
jgi:Coenzyme PQQ synthesis protein D (PqqD)